MTSTASVTQRRTLNVTHTARRATSEKRERDITTTRSITKNTGSLKVKSTKAETAMRDLLANSKNSTRLSDPNLGSRVRRSVTKDSRTDSGIGGQTSSFNTSSRLRSSMPARRKVSSSLSTQSIESVDEEEYNNSPGCGVIIDLFAVSIQIHDILKPLFRE